MIKIAVIQQCRWMSHGLFTVFAQMHIESYVLTYCAVPRTCSVRDHLVEQEKKNLQTRFNYTF